MTDLTPLDRPHEPEREIEMSQPRQAQRVVVTAEDIDGSGTDLLAVINKAIVQAAWDAIPDPSAAYLDRIDQEENTDE